MPHALKMSSSDRKKYTPFAATEDPDTLEALVKRWGPQGYRVARLICRNDGLAEEALQNAFMQLLSPRTRFVALGKQSFRSWFLTVVVNCARMHVRAERRNERKKSNRLYLSNHTQTDGTPPEVLADGLRGDLQKGLGTLDAHIRKTLELHFFKGWRQCEIAAALGASQQMISRRIQEGLALLRAVLAH